MWAALWPSSIFYEVLSFVARRACAAAISSCQSWGASVECWGSFGIEATSEEGPG